MKNGIAIIFRHYFWTPRLVDETFLAGFFVLAAKKSFTIHQTYPSVKVQHVLYRVSRFCVAIVVTWSHLNTVQLNTNEMKETALGYTRRCLSFLPPQSLSPSVTKRLRWLPPTSTLDCPLTTSLTWQRTLTTSTRKCRVGCAFSSDWRPSTSARERWTS